MENEYKTSKRIKLNKAEKFEDPKKNTEESIRDVVQ